MARVLILTLIFQPDGVSTATIMGDIAADLQAAGHEVTVVTTVPHYNRDPVAETNQPLTPVLRWLVWRSTFRGVPVLHVAMPRKGPRIMGRLFAWVQFHLLSFLVAVAWVRRVDVIIAPSPPLTVGVFAWLLGLVYRAPFIYIVQELYPDIAISLGALKSRWLITPLFALERFVYARARVITVIADRMRRRLVTKKVPPDKVRVVPNFVNDVDIRPEPKVNEFSRKHGLDNCFVVTYAGNMGPAQGMETIIEAAALLSNQTEVKFLLVGDGGLREALSTTVRERRMSNVIILPHQPYALVPQIYGTSDVSLVPLAANAGTDAVPSKVYRIMAAERPVIACADSDSDLATLVIEARSGLVVAPGSARGLADAILELWQDSARRARMGAAGRRHVIAHYRRGTIVAQYERIICELSSR